MQQILNEVKQSSSTDLNWAWRSSAPACLLFFCALQQIKSYLNMNIAEIHIRLSDNNIFMQNDAILINPGVLNIWKYWYLEEQTWAL